MKRSVRPSQSAFFELGPAHLLPLLDSLLVAPARPPGWPLATPVEFAQDAPYLRGIVPHAMLLLDQLGHPRQRPQPAQISELLGPLLEALFELRHLGFVQLGRPARPLCSVQTGAAFYL
jgi:hypothetical protein